MPGEEHIAFNHLSRSQRFILGSVTIFTLAVAIWLPYVYFYFITVGEKTANSSIIKLLSEARVPVPTNDLPQNAAANALDEQIESTGTCRLIIKGARAHSTLLSNLKIGKSIYSDGYLPRLPWRKRRETRNYDRITVGFKKSIKNNITDITGEWRNTTIFTGKLNGSFVTSARAAGMTGSDVTLVIKALQWQLDLRKLRQGDQFVVLSARKKLDGKNAPSKLLGIRLRTGSKDYYAFRADDGQFYNRDASGLARGFLRLPTRKQFRVSSNFNPSRLNPITGRIAPHLGVDFAVPVGTPVLAVDDGGVLVSKRDDAAGNYVAIRHGSQYMTRYMHLKKLLVKQGQKVKRGDRIALSGNTGRSSGPHLHFEVWINHQAVNPLTTTLLRTEKLIGNDRLAYLAQVKQILPQLQLN